jgi:hemolysin activation/secretion protein
MLLVAASLLAAAPATMAASGAMSPGAIQNAFRDADSFYGRPDLGAAPAKPSTAAGSRAVVEGPKPDSSTSVLPNGAGSAERIWVSRIDITESQVLSRTALSQLTKPLEQRAVGLDQLRQLVDGINALYREGNYVTAKAVLPPQQIVDGVVRIELIEARIDEVDVVDNRTTRDGYIKRRLGVREGAFADVNALEDALRAFNAVNDVQLRALLQPGSRPHTTSYVVQAAEPERHHLAVFVDNAGREVIGRERAGLTYTNSSLTGYRDRLSAGFSVADGANAGYLVYGRPLNRFGTLATVGVDYSQIVIVSGELATFGVKGESTIVSAFLSHPLRVGPVGSLYGLIGISLKDSATNFDGVDRFESAVRLLSIGADYQRVGNRFTLYARPRLNVGVERLGGDSSFTTFNGDAGMVMSPANAHQFALRVRGQLADTRLLPSAEQFQLGGVASVRGYPEGLLIGDEGYFVSAEYRYLGLSGGMRHAWQPFLFADHGGVFTAATGEPHSHSRYLTSAGMGLSYRYSDRLTANLQVGFPLSGRPALEDDYAVHFHISYMPF